MAIRMTGINSGLDTDSIVQALVSAQSLKVTKVQNKLTKSEWTQEKWKDLNTKLYSLYTTQLTKFKTQGSYNARKATSSDSTICTATASNSASVGSHSLEVQQVASSQTLTGSSLTASTDKTKLTTLGMTAGAVIQIGTSKGTTDFEVTDNTTISDFVSALRKAGLNASYDTGQKRFFISSKTCGAENAFTLTTVDGDTNKDNKLKTLEDDILGEYTEDYEAAKQEVADAIKTLKNATSEQLQKMVEGTFSESDDDYEKLQAAYDSIVDYAGYETTDNLITDVINKKQTGDASQVTAAWDAIDQAVQASAPMTALKTDADTATATARASLALVEAMDKEGLTKLQESLEVMEDLSSEERMALESAYTTGSTDDLSEELKGKYDAYKYAKENDELVKAYEYLNAMSGDFVDNLEDYVNSKEFADQSGSKDQLSFLGLMQVTDSSVEGTNNGVTLQKAKDAVIVLDGATMTEKTNNFTINGVSFNITNKTQPGQAISLTVSNDSDAVYKVVKDFVKGYNDILKEMNKLYKAESAKGYDPLTDEEKEAMSEDQIEKWETKIKDSLLRNDQTLGTLINSMRSALNISVKVNGKSYSLGSFGVKTSSDYTEGGLLHILGDSEDETYSSEANKLKEMIESDSDAVMEALSAIGNNLYATMKQKMSKTSVSSALTFYNDKQITSDQTKYKKEISKLQDKLTDLEDRYYDKFTAMESAMAKLNSQTSALSSLMGGYY